MERMQKHSKIIQIELSKGPIQKEIYILFHGLTEKLQKLKTGISMHGRSLAKSFKITRPTWSEFLQGSSDFQQPQ